MTSPRYQYKLGQVHPIHGKSKCSPEIAFLQCSLEKSTQICLKAKFPITLVAYKYKQIVTHIYKYENDQNNIDSGVHIHCLSQSKEYPPVCSKYLCP